MSKPTLIAIDHDDYHASHVGCLLDGRQFFLTQPFVPAIDGNPGRQFISVYLFDKHGRFLEARIGDLGSRAEAHLRYESAFQKRLAELGPVEYCRIRVRPFEIERFGTVFGLVTRPPEEDDDDWRVALQPGNYVAFHEPWESGDYYT